MPAEDPFDALHRQLFGYVPAKHGTTYERLAAIVLAVLGWHDIVQAKPEKPVARRTKQVLDIVARNPLGEQRRMIVECKHKEPNGNVGKGVMDKLVGIRAQLGADDLCVITTEDFTKGARDVAFDEDIAMVKLRSYDPTTDHFVLRVEATFRPQNPPVISNVDVQIGETEGLESETTVQFDLRTPLETDDGAAAGTLEDVLEVNALRPKAGTFERRQDLLEQRWLSVANGRIRLKSVAWREEISFGQPFSAVSEIDGAPTIVVEQLDEDGKGASRRLLVDKALFAWDIDEQNRVVSRGQLT
jgi:hypothetical protein